MRTTFANLNKLVTLSIVLQNSRIMNSTQSENRPYQIIIVKKESEIRFYLLTTMAIIIAAANTLKLRYNAAYTPFGRQNENMLSINQHHIN